MKLSLITGLLLLSGAAVAEVPYASWNQDRLGHGSPANDTMRCMALHCTEPGPSAEVPGYPSKEIIDAPRYWQGAPVPPKHIADLIKDLDVEPIVPAKPASESEARDAYWRTLRNHADGAATIEQVEAAYRELLPYRR